MIQAPVVLGLDFGGTKIAAAVCRLDGTRLGSATVGSGGELGARASFDRGVATARDLLARTAPGVPLAAVGVSTFGIPFDDRVELAPAISGWGQLPLGRELRAAFPGSVVRMATDAKAAAAAEVRWGTLPAATRLSTSTSAPGCPPRWCPAARSSGARTAPPGRSATTCGPWPTSDARSMTGCRWRT